MLYTTFSGMNNNKIIRERERERERERVLTFWVPCCECSYGFDIKAIQFFRNFFLRIENLGTEKKLFVLQEATTEAMLRINNWCTLQWSLEVKTYSVLWNLFKGYSFWIRIWLTLNCLFTFFAIYFVDRKYGQQLDRYR